MREEVWLGGGRGGDEGVVHLRALEVEVRRGSYTSSLDI